MSFWLLFLSGTPCGSSGPERQSSTPVPDRRAQPPRAAEPRYPGPPAVWSYRSHDELRSTGGHQYYQNLLPQRPKSISPRAVSQDIRLLLPEFQITKYRNAAALKTLDFTFSVQSFLQCYSVVAIAQKTKKKFSLIFKYCIIAKYWFF